MIDFSLAPKTLKAKRLEHNAAEYLRSIARYYDDHEHEELKPEEIKRVLENAEATGAALAEPGPGDGGMLATIILSEESCMGDPMIPQTIAGFGLGNAAAVCGACHTNTLGNHSTGDSTASRTIDFNGVTTYKFGPNNPVYNGTYNSSSATSPKSCSNVSCHYFTTPNWSNF